METGGDQALNNDGGQEMETGEGQDVEIDEGQRVETGDGQRAETGGGQGAETGGGQRAETGGGQVVNVGVGKAEDAVKGGATANASLSVNIPALRAINPDILGWIRIPGTTISYPLMQGESNLTYLRNAYDKSDSKAGSIFMDYRNAGDFSDQNTIIYGHNMRNRTMFGSLRNFRDVNYIFQHPIIEIYTDAGLRKYKIFSVVKLEMNDKVYYNLRFSSTERYRQFLLDLVSRAVADPGLMFTPNDPIVTLSTCTSSSETERLIVCGVLDSVEANPYRSV
jgi:sortase B